MLGWLSSLRRFRAGSTAYAVTRRTLLQTIGGAAVARAANAFQPGKLTWNEGPQPKTLNRHYRADAHVVVLAVPLLHRTGVGGGSAVWRESNDPEGNLLRFLEFNGFSLPARAAGLNRLGFIRELSRMDNSGAVESLYFGLMTASPEESMEQARRSLNSKAREQVYSVIDGHIAPGIVETTTAHFAAPSTLSADHRAELIDRARQALAGPEKTATGAVPTAANAPSFLQTLADMLRRPDRNQATYQYSGRAYSLWMTRAPDAKAAAFFKERQLIAGDHVTRVSGRLRRQAGGKDTEFRLWIEDGVERPIPLRIEYHAKSYLHLVFEVDG